MDNIDKIMNLYQSGRYECDQFFYEQLIKIAEHLDLFHLTPLIQHNLEIVKRVAKLTQKHLNVLQNQDDEEGAMQILHQINSQIKTIDTNKTQTTINEIKRMAGKSYKQRIIHDIKTKPYKQAYLEICERILTSIHDPKIILQDLSILGIFMHQNEQKIDKYIEIYENVLKNGIQQLKKFRNNCEFIRNNQKIKDHPKVQNYIGGSQVVLHTLIKINQIYKILKGNNKFGLKLGSVKHEIEAQNNNNKPIQPINIAAYHQWLLNQNQQLPKYCNINLRAPDDQQQCVNIIKMFYKLNTQ